MSIIFQFRLFCLCGSVFLSCNLLAQQAPEIEWQHALGGSLDESGLAMDHTSDGGYIIAGRSLSSNGDVPGNHGETDWWIVKLNSMGSVVWSEHYGGAGNEQPNSIRHTSDGGFVVAGSTRSNDLDVTLNQGLYDLWVVKLSAMGDIEWQQTYGGSLDDTAFDIQETSDGGYVVVGETRSSDGDVSFNNGFTDCWLIKISSTGDLLWERTYGGSSAETGFSVKVAPDGGFIIGANASSSNGDITNPIGLEDFWLIKTDPQGVIQWERSYGGSNTELGCDVVLTDNGGYIISGRTSSNDGDIENYYGLGDIWVASLNEIGDIIWSRTLGGSATDQPRRISLHPSGDILIAGFTDSTDGDITFHNGDRDGWVLRISSTGELLWQRAMGGSGSDGFVEVLPTADGGYILAGSTTSNDGDVSGNNGARDMWVVKLLPDPTAVAEEFPYATLNSWPNPTTGVVWVDVSAFGNTKNFVRIHSANGASALEPRAYGQVAANGKIQIDLSPLPAGLFQIVISDGKQQGLVRVVKQ